MQKFIIFMYNKETGTFLLNFMNFFTVPLLPKKQNNNFFQKFNLQDFHAKKGIKILKAEKR